MPTTEKLDPAMQPGLGWYHRIDDVPTPGTNVEIVTVEGEQLSAKVLASTSDERAAFTGIGCDVAYYVAEMNTTLLANAVAWIKEKKGG